MPKAKAKPKTSDKHTVSLPLVALATVFAVMLFALIVLPEVFASRYERADALASTTAAAPAPPPVLNKVEYDRRMLALANYGTSTASTTASSTPHLWPAKTPYPNAGAILPFHRIVAYYGNFYSTQMGVLGEYPPDVMLGKLNAEVANWEAADPSTPVIPAIQYIAVTAQGSPQPDDTYRLRMPDDQIQKALDLANEEHGLLILDVQVGLSSLPEELPPLEAYLKLPNVELAIDPEFSMHDGEKPGTVIGTMSSSDINYAINYLDEIVSSNDLPPKILVIHRFTEDMVTGYENIAPTTNVQVVMDMDGWGSPAKKLGTYNHIIAPEPVQFTGFKLFYINDLRPPSTRMLTPAELLQLKPIPIYIQYQ